MRHVRERWRGAMILVSLLLLAACGPSSADTSPRYDYERDATYDVRAGETLYVTARYELAELGLSVEDVRQARLNWFPAGLRGDSANASPLLRFAPPEAPSGWEVRLWQSRMVRQRPLGRPDGDYSYHATLELRVDVPEEAYDLTRRVRSEVTVRGGETVRLDFLVRAR